MPGRELAHSRAVIDHYCLGCYDEPVGTFPGSGIKRGGKILGGPDIVDLQR